MAPNQIIAASLMLFLQAAQAQPPKPADGWRVVQQDRSCKLVRSVGAESRALLTVNRNPFLPVTSLELISPDVPNVAPYDLLPASVRDERTGRMVQARGGVRTFKGRPDRQLNIYGVDTSFVDALNDGSTLVIQLRGKSIASVPMAGLTAAVTARSLCTEELLRTWGIDPAAIAGLRALPEPANDPSRWVTTDDYPPHALMREATGRSTVRYRVTLEGRVADCTVAETSGNAALDDASCKALTKRARYRPAIGSDGAPTATWVAATFTWDIP